MIIDKIKIIITHRSEKAQENFSNLVKIGFDQGPDGVSLEINRLFRIGSIDYIIKGLLHETLILQKKNRTTDKDNILMLEYFEDEIEQLTLKKEKIMNKLASTEMLNSKSHQDSLEQISSEDVIKDTLNKSKVSNVSIHPHSKGDNKSADSGVNSFEYIYFINTFWLIHFISNYCLLQKIQNH